MFDVFVCLKLLPFLSFCSILCTLVGKVSNKTVRAISESTTKHLSGRQAIVSSRGRDRCRRPHPVSRGTAAATAAMTMAMMVSTAATGATAVHHHHGGSSGRPVRGFDVLQSGIKLHQDKDHVRRIEDKVPGRVGDDVALAGDARRWVLVHRVTRLQGRMTQVRHLLLVVSHASARIPESIDPDAQHAVLAQRSHEQVSVLSALLPCHTQTHKDGT